MGGVVSGRRASLWRASFAARSLQSFVDYYPHSMNTFPIYTITLFKLIRHNPNTQKVQHHPRGRTISQPPQPSPSPPHTDMAQRTNLNMRRASEPAPSFIAIRSKVSSTPSSLSSSILPASWGLRRHSNQNQRNRSFNSKKTPNPPTDRKQMVANFCKQAAIFYTEVIYLLLLQLFLYGYIV